MAKSLAVAPSLAPPITPMHPTLVREPFHCHGWIYERKEDGWRVLAMKDGSRVRLVSRHAVDHTGRFPQSVPRWSTSSPLPRWCFRRSGPKATGLDCWDEVRRRGWEGMVAKDESSRYVAARSRSWVK